MFRKLEEQRVHIGEDGVDLHFLMEPDELYNACRLYARITVAPGKCIAFHRHEAEMESFYVMAGECRMDDDGTTRSAKPGDILFTRHGEGHAVYNTGETPLELMALIVNREQGVFGRG